MCSLSSLAELTATVLLQQQAGSATSLVETSGSDKHIPEEQLPDSQPGQHGGYVRERVAACLGLPVPTARGDITAFGSKSSVKCVPIMQAMGSDGYSPV